jgi:hypothetical protein
MQDASEDSPRVRHRDPWNKGKLIGPKSPLRPKHVWSIRSKLQAQVRQRDLAMFNLAIDSKLRGCDIVRLMVDDIVPQGLAAQRAAVRQTESSNLPRSARSSFVGVRPCSNPS